MREGDLMRLIMVRASKLGQRLFRVNTGLAWCGTRIPAPTAYGPNTVVLLNARPFKAGVKGMSDLVGWETITITPEMVGTKIARFKAREVKAGSRTTKEQVAFLKLVIESGGDGKIATSEEDA